MHPPITLTNSPITSDLIETPVYFDQGIDSNNLKSFRWIKQKADKFINGELVTKVRPSIEPLVFPEARIIKDLGSGDSTIHIDNVGVGTNSLTNLFFYENPNKIGTIVFDESVEPRAADLTAVVSTGGTIQSITINDGGKGYVGSSTALSIASPISNTGVALTASLREIKVYTTFPHRCSSSRWAHGKASRRSPSPSG